VALQQDECQDDYATVLFEAGSCNGWQETLRYTGIFSGVALLIASMPLRIPKDGEVEIYEQRENEIHETSVSSMEEVESHRDLEAIDEEIECLESSLASKPVNNSASNNMKSNDQSKHVDRRNIWHRGQRCISTIWLHGLNVNMNSKKGLSNSKPRNKKDNIWTRRRHESSIAPLGDQQLTSNVTEDIKAPQGTTLITLASSKKQVAPRGIQKSKQRSFTIPDLSLLDSFKTRTYACLIFGRPLVSLIPWPMA